MQRVPCIECVQGMELRYRIVVVAHFRVYVGLGVTPSRGKAICSTVVHPFLEIFSNFKSSASNHDVTATLRDRSERIPAVFPNFGGEAMFTKYVNLDTHACDGGGTAER